MRQVVISSPGTVELREAPLPTPRKGQVRVRSLLAGICGSDLHGLAGNHPFIEFPYVPGHESPNLVCGTCSHCASGRYNLCERLLVVGGQVAGAMAETFIAPAGRFHVVPNTMSDAEAALIEPLSTAVHATRVAGNLEGRLTAVLAGGTIGLLVLGAALLAGAKAVAVSEPVTSKRTHALRLGSSFCCDPGEADPVSALRDALAGRPDIVFDCVASQASTHQSIRLAKKGGRIVVVGVAAGDVRVPLHIIQDREICIEGSAMYVKQDVLQAIEFMRDRKVHTLELVTAMLPLAEAREAFALARSGDSVKVHVATSF